MKTVKKVVKNDELKNHLEQQDKTLSLLEKAVNQITILLQDNSGKISHLFRWKEREREKQGRITFRTASIAIKIMSILGFIVALVAIVYGGYRLINWIFYGR